MHVLTGHRNPERPLFMYWERLVEREDIGEFGPLYSEITRHHAFRSRDDEFNSPVVKDYAQWDAMLRALVSSLECM